MRNLVVLWRIDSTVFQYLYAWCWPLNHYHGPLTSFTLYRFSLWSAGSLFVFPCWTVCPDFWQFLVANLLKNVAQIFGDFCGYFETSLLGNLKLQWLLFGQVLEIFWLFLISTSHQTIALLLSAFHLTFFLPIYKARKMFGESSAQFETFNHSLHKYNGTIYCLLSYVNTEEGENKCP